MARKMVAMTLLATDEQAAVKAAIVALNGVKSLNGLRAVNEVLSARWKKMAELQELRAVIDKGLAVGVRVRFEGRHGDVVVGTIEKVNTKSVKILTDGGQRWTVSPSFVRVVEASGETKTA